MVAGGLVGPALTLVRGISRDLRFGSDLVNSIRDIDGFLAWSVRKDKYLSSYICPHIYTGDSFSVVGPISDASILEIFRYGERVVSTRVRLNFRDGYLLDFAGVVRYNWSVFGTDCTYYCSNSRRSSFGFVHLHVCFSFSVGSVERFRYSKPSLLELPVSLFWFCPKTRVLTFSIRYRRKLLCRVS